MKLYVFFLLNHYLFVLIEVTKYLFKYFKIIFVWFFFGKKISKASKYSFKVIEYLFKTSPYGLFGTCFSIVFFYLQKNLNASTTL